MLTYEKIQEIMLDYMQATTFITGEILIEEVVSGEFLIAVGFEKMSFGLKGSIVVKDAKGMSVLEDVTSKLSCLMGYEGHRIPPTIDNLFQAKGFLTNVLGE